MSIIDLDCELQEDLFLPDNKVKKFLLTSSSTDESIALVPKSLIQKWKIPTSGYYVPTDVRLAITPHVSEKHGAKAVVELVDMRDPSPSRVLFRSKEFNLGTGLTLEGSQLPFCLPVGDYPIVFVVTVSQSQFKEGSRMYSALLSWRMMYSTTPLSRVVSVIGQAIVPVREAPARFKMIKKEPQLREQGSKNVTNKTKKALTA